METAATLPLRDRVARFRPEWPAISAWLLPFALVVYLALKGGGYDPIIRSEVGIAVWWIVLLGALVGILPAVRIGAAAWVGLGLLAAFAVWTALGIGWSESAERSVAELGRVAMYLGVFVLALGARRPDTARHALNALAVALAFVTGLALLSRIHPAWFPANDTGSFLPSESYRLNYPINYWNGLAALLALGLPLLLGVACAARTLLARALAAAALPAIALTIFFTYSRGGILAASAALLVFFALAPNRLPKLATLLAAGAGGAILIAAANQRDALANGLQSQIAQRQGSEMLAMVLVVCAGVALIQVGIALAVRHGRRPRWLPTPSPRRAAAILGIVLVAGATVSLAAGRPSELSQRWHDFKQSKGPAAGSSRFSSSVGNGRYQYWQAAAGASASDPLKGTGPDTYEYEWNRRGTRDGFVRDAHSLYMQTLAETGVVGLALLGSFLALTLGTGAVRALRAPSARRTHLAAATAGCAAFCVAAAADWIWQIPVLPACLLLMAAVVLTSGRQEHAAPRERRRLTGRAVFASLAVASLVAIAIPMAGAASLRQSQLDARSSNLAAALAEARTAERTEPYAAAPRMQEALLLELKGDLGGAAAAASAATHRESTNWRTWAILARLEAKRGRAAQAVTAYDRARSLNPRSPLFSQ
jgi:hypothetical protein